MGKELSDNCLRHETAINNIEKNCVLISSKIDSLIAVSEKNNSKIDEINHKLYIDNGTPSILNRIKDAEKSLVKIEDENLKKKNLKEYIVLAIISQLIIISIGWIGNNFKIEKIKEEIKKETQIASQR